MFVSTKTRSQPPNVIRRRIVPNGLWVFLARQTPRSRHADVREQADVPFVMHIPISTLAIQIVMLDAMNKLGALEVLKVGFLLHQFNDRPLCVLFLQDRLGGRFISAHQPSHEGQQRRFCLCAENDQISKRPNEWEVGLVTKSSLPVTIASLVEGEPLALAHDAFEPELAGLSLQCPAPPLAPLVRPARNMPPVIS